MSPYIPDIFNGPLHIISFFFGQVIALHHNLHGCMYILRPFSLHVPVNQPNHNPSISVLLVVNECRDVSRRKVCSRNIWFPDLDLLLVYMDIWMPRSGVCAIVCLRVASKARWGEEPMLRQGLKT